MPRESTIEQEKQEFLDKVIDKISEEPELWTSGTYQKLIDDLVLDMAHEHLKEVILRVGQVIGQVAEDPEIANTVNDRADDIERRVFQFVSRHPIWGGLIDRERAHIRRLSGTTELTKEIKEALCPRSTDSSLS